MIDGYPLQYPVGKQRTIRPERARFGQHSVSQAINYLKDEVYRLGGKDLVISTNLVLTLTGIPKSGQRNPSDSGVAVYFKLKDKDQCFPCDRWDKVEHNIWAIYKSIEALRGLDRWGAKDMVESAFKGFQALPSPDQVTNTKVRYFAGCNTLSEGKERFRNMVAELHPDNKETGDQNKFIELNNQYTQFKQSMEGVQ
jgi:hypothetical protein